jgi:SOS-response transcriptional repressor LexA
MNFSARLKAARKHAGLTQGELAAKLGINQVSISDLERGKSQSSSHAYKMALICKVTPDWLIMGEGSMLDDPATVQAHGSDVEPGPDMPGSIPIISYIQAGEFCEAVDLFQPGYAEDFLPIRPANAGPHVYALRVEGRSNHPVIQDGEVVIVDPDKPADSGKFVVAKRHSDGHVTLKQLKYSEGVPYIEAANENWPDRIIRVDGDWSICGVVVGKYQPM